MTSLLNSSLITALLCSKTSDASNFRLKAKFLTKPKALPNLSTLCIISLYSLSALSRY